MPCISKIGLNYRIIAVKSVKFQILTTLSLSLTLKLGYWGLKAKIQQFKNNIFLEDSNFEITNWFKSTYLLYILSWSDREPSDHLLHLKITCAVNILVYVLLNLEYLQCTNISYIVYIIFAIFFLPNYPSYKYLPSRVLILYWRMDLDTSKNLNFFFTFLWNVCMLW